MIVARPPFRLLAALLVWLALLPSLGEALGPGRTLSEFGQQTWQSDSGLPQNTVRAMLQTRDGFLWLGTEAGLVRFDGSDFRVFDPSNTPAMTGMASGFIRSLAEDRSGTLWIGTANGLLAEHNGSFRRYGPADGLPEPDVFAVHVLADGRVVTLTAAGAALLVRNRDQDKFKPLSGTNAARFTDGAASVIEDIHGNAWLVGSAEVFSLGAASASAIATPEIGRVQALAPSLAGGDLWVGGSSGLVVLRGGMHDGRRTHFTTADGLPSDDVTALVATALGLWVGTGEGLAFIPTGGNPAAVEVLPELAGHRVQQLFADREGTLWAATTEGIARITNRHAEYVRRRPALPGVLAICEDREGSMWFGTDSSGLSVLREQAFSTLTTDDGLSAAVVRAVFEDHAGTLWIGTAHGLDSYAREGANRSEGVPVQPFSGALPSQVILALAETRNAADQSDIWVGTPAGLARIEGSTTRTYTTADGLADDFVRSLYADPDGTLWIGTRNGLSQLQDGRFHSWTALDGLGSDLVGAIVRTRDGTLWVGTLSGLSYRTGDTFGTIPSAAVTALLEDSSGALWVATNGRGLSLVRDGRLQPLPSGSELPATIYGMLEDARGNLWLSSRTGVVRVALAALHAFAGDPRHAPAITSYGTADGMRIREASGGGHPAAWRTHDGALWFATLNGAAVVHPETAVRNKIPPINQIEQVLVDGAVVTGNGPFRVPAGHGRLTLSYAGLSFVAPSKVRYRYMLEGFDKDWIDAGSRRTAFYTNVPPGTYHFLVLSANNDGLWSRVPASAGFTVEPFYYQTAWFYALVALALAGSAYLIYYVRVRSVEAGYRAVLDERGRIAREIHDTLAQGYVAVTVQLELAERLLGVGNEDAGNAAAVSAVSAKAISAVKNQLRATRALVRESLEEARSSIWNLRAQADAATLPAQLAETVRRYSQRSAASIKFAVHGTYRPLPALEPEIQRIAQEALANAVTHARANAISVTLTYEAALLLLRVADDGIGLPPTPALPGHFGLEGMRERAARIHAILKIEPGPGSQGTLVTLRVGLEAERKQS